MSVSMCLYVCVCLSTSIIISPRPVFASFFVFVTYGHGLPSVLWRCWLGGRKGIRSVKNWWGAGVVICLERGADLHMVQLMLLPLTVSCLSNLIQIGFTFLVPGSPGQRAVNRVCVCVCVRVYLRPWLGSLLAGLSYVLYFRFYGWRHFFA